MSSQIPLPNSPQLPLTETGIAEVDQALAELVKLENTEITEHAEIYTQVHSKLTAALADIDE